MPWLQEACTLFLYFFWAILMVTSSVSEQVKQSPEADSISELATFSLDMSESDEIPLWPTTVPSPGSVVALVGLEGGW